MQQVLKKAELIDSASEKSGLSKKDTQAALDGILETVTGTLKDGGKVQLTGFGTFEVRERKARTGVKPGTSEKIAIPASKAPAFKAGKSLKDAVRA